MTDENKCTLECPTCSTLNRLEFFINARTVSTSLDRDQVKESKRLLNELKLLHKTYVRKPTNMMAAQNAIGETNAISKGKEGENKEGN